MKSNIKSTHTSIADLNLKTVIEIPNSVDENGKPQGIAVDFTDRRFANKIMHLIHKWNNIEGELNEKYNGIDDIEDEFDRLMAISDAEVEVLEKFKADVNEAFGCDIVGALYGDCLPSVERYAVLFDALTPYVLAASENEKKRVSSVLGKYSAERIKGTKGKSKKPATKPVVKTAKTDKAPEEEE